MFETLFGSEMPLAARFFVAFLVVLALSGLTAWLVRRFGANRLGSGARGRQPRLASARTAAPAVGAETAHQPGGQTNQREHHQKRDEKPRSQRHLRAKQGLEHQCTPYLGPRLMGRESPKWLIP